MAKIASQKLALYARAWFTFDADGIGSPWMFLWQYRPVPHAKTQANSEYAQRVDQVIDSLRGNLHRPVKLAELANIACFS
jgi:hypothetical protein